MCVAKVGAQEIGAKQMKALAKADAAIEHPKKSHKGETWLEHGEAYMEAHAIDPTNIDTVDYLKSLGFRLRDMDGMMAKYETYKAMKDAL